MDLAAATALSDLLDLERESLLRRHAAGRLSYSPWDLASVAETATLCKRIERDDREMREDWQDLLLAGVSTSRRKRAAAAQLRHRVSRTNPKLLLSHDTAAREEARARTRERSEAALAGAPPPPPSAGPPPPSAVGGARQSFRTSGAASHTFHEVRASPSGFSRLLRQCHSQGGQLSAKSIPSRAAATAAGTDHLNELRRTRSQPFDMVPAERYHAAAARAEATPPRRQPTPAAAATPPPSYDDQEVTMPRGRRRRRRRAGRAR